MMRFDLSNLGLWVEGPVFRVTAEQTVAYARATNDENPRHLDGALAPPVFSVVPSLMGVMTKALWSVAVSDREGYDTRNVHGEQDIFLKQPIIPGMTLRTRAATVGVHAKAKGTIIVTRTETRDERETLLNVQYFTNMIRGVIAPESAGEWAPQRDLPETSPPGGAPDTRTYHIDADQSVRYASASGDNGSYHLDLNAATAAGYPSLILHGLCTMAFAGRAIVSAVCDGDSSLLTRLAVRFSRPVTLGQDVTTTLWSTGDRGELAFYSFEMTDQSGQPVLTRGLAEVRAG